jgi:hypothetical protein
VSSSSASEIKATRSPMQEVNSKYLDGAMMSSETVIGWLKFWYRDLVEEMIATNGMVEILGLFLGNSHN